MCNVPWWEVGLGLWKDLTPRLPLLDRLLLVLWRWRRRGRRAWRDLRDCESGQSREVGMDVVCHGNR